MRVVRPRSAPARRCGWAEAQAAGRTAEALLRGSEDASERHAGEEWGADMDLLLWLSGFLAGVGVGLIAANIFEW